MQKSFFGSDGICFEIIDVLIITRPTTRKYRTEPRPFCSLSVRLSGSATFYFGKEKIDVDQNQLLFCPKDTGYSQSSKSEKIVAIHLNIHDDVKLVPQKITVSPKAQETFLAVYDVWNKKNKGYKYLAHSLLACYLAEFSGDSLWAKDYIEKNLANPNLSVKELAQNECVSEQYFRKKFKSEYGISPSNYLINRRIERAKALLDTNYYNVSEVAKMVGIDDSLYFSTLFKKHVGIPPSKYQSQR